MTSRDGESMAQLRAPSSQLHQHQQQRSQGGGYSNQAASGGAHPPSHFHHFHQHNQPYISNGNNEGGYGDHRSHNAYAGSSVQGGAGNANLNAHWGNNHTNTYNSSSNPNGGYNTHNLPPPPPQGGGGGGGGGMLSTHQGYGPGNMGRGYLSPSPQQSGGMMQQNPYMGRQGSNHNRNAMRTPAPNMQPPPQQQAYYPQQTQQTPPPPVNYNSQTGMRGSAPPPHMEPPLGYSSPPMMMRIDNGFGGQDMGNTGSPPPQGANYNNNYGNPSVGGPPGNYYPGHMRGGNNMNGGSPGRQVQQQQQPPPPPMNSDNHYNMMEPRNRNMYNNSMPPQQVPPPHQPPPPPQQQPMLMQQNMQGGVRMPNQDWAGASPMGQYNNNNNSNRPILPPQGAHIPPMNVPVTQPQQMPPQGPPGSLAGGVPPGPMYSGTYPPPHAMSGNAGPMDAAWFPMANSLPEMQESFYEFLKNRMLLKTCSLRDFFPPGYDPKTAGPVTMAIDGNYIISSLRDRLQEMDPLWFLHSPLPDMLLSLIEENVKRMREKNLEPIWVFNGVGVSGDVEAFLPSNDELIARDQVWQKLMEGFLPTSTEAAVAFDTSSSIGEDVLMAAQRFLRSHLGVLTVTAPFLNWCQMATFHIEGDASLLMGPPEMLLVPYQPMKLIVEMDIGAETVSYFDRDHVLRQLFPNGVNGDSTEGASDRLMDFGLLITSHPAITAVRASVPLTANEIYDELALPNNHHATVQRLISPRDMGNAPNQHRPGAEVMKQTKGRFYLQYSAVFSKKTPDSPLVYFKRVLNPSLTNANMPSNLSGVFGNLVPLSLFYFQFTGLLSVSLMTIITQAYFRDEFPLSDTLEYHRFLPTLVALRGQIVFQVVRLMRSETYRQRLEKISWVRWFDKILMGVTRPAETILLDEWQLDGCAELAHVFEGALENAPLFTVLSLNSTEICISAAKAIEENGGKVPILYHGKKQAFMAILLKAFDLLGYFSHTAAQGLEEGAVDDQGVLYDANGTQEYDHMIESGDAPPVDGSGTGTFFTMYLCRSLEQCPQSFHSALVRFTELSRVGIINAAHCEYLRLPVEVMPVPNDSDEPAEVLLASRIACLIAIPYMDPDTLDQDFQWAPVYSRHLCAFSIMARYMNHYLRELVEVIAATVFLNEFSDCGLDDFASFSPHLPFGDVPSSIGGLLLHYVLVFPADYEHDRNTPKERCDYLQGKFRNIPDLPQQLRTVMEFTFQALYLLNAYRYHDHEPIKAVELRTTSVVEDTLGLMYEKWRLHFADPPPSDIHQIWQPDRILPA